MFFKKSEPKRWHPCLVLTIGALSIIGAVTIANASKCAINTAKTKIKSFFSPKQSGASSKDGSDMPEFPFSSRTHLGEEE